jgi:hypothetical protein
MNLVRFLRALAANLPIIALALLGYAGIVSLCISHFARHRPSVMVDVVFVFDTTGSMQDKIDGLLSTSSRFVNILQQAGADYQLAMVTFGALDETTSIRETFPPGHDLAAFQRFLRRTRARGGGREDQLGAMKYALATFPFRTKSHRILILITDEPFYGAETTDLSLVARQEWEGVIDQLSAAQVTGYAISPPDESFRHLPERTGGRFYDIDSQRNFTDILINIAQHINAGLTQ